MAGWIKLSRKLLKNPIWDNEKLLKVWIWCLLKASHTDCEVQVGLQRIKLKPGQFVTGRFAGAKEVGFTPSTFWKYIKTLEIHQKVDIKSNNKFSVISVVKWGFYQDSNEDIGQQNGQQSNSKVTTNEQQSNTNKNGKNGKNEKNNKVVYAEFVKLIPAEHQKLVDAYGDANTKKLIETLNNYKGATGKKYKSDYLAILNWVVEKVGCKGIQSEEKDWGYE